MKIKELIEELKKYPEDSFVEVAVEGKLGPANKVLYWKKDRNDFESVVIIPPLTDKGYEKIYENHRNS